MIEKASLEKKDCFISYTEPTLTDEVVYESDSFVLRKIWEWNIVSAYKDAETGLLKSLIVGPYFGSGISTYILPTGKRLSYQNFTDTDNFHYGLAPVRGINGKYGLADKNLNICIPMEYDYLECLKSFVIAKKNGIPSLLDKSGEEIKINLDYQQYTIADIENYYGICVVHVKDKNGHVDEIAIDAKGNIASDKYSYGSCEDEDTGTDHLVFVTQYKDGMLKRGAVNVDLEEVVPCEFYELGWFFDCDDFLRARIKDKWGVIDNRGNWVVEPMFGYIYHEIENNLILFSEEDEWFEGPQGVYDIKQKKVLLEPQFEYVSFLGNDMLEVEIRDENQKSICEIIKSDGTVLYSHPHLSDVYDHDNYIKLAYYEDGMRYSSILDRDLNEIVSAEHKIEIHYVYNQKCFTFKKEGKIGLMSFDLKVMVEPIYDELHSFSWSDIIDDMLVAKIDDKFGLITTDGKIILPLKYSCVHSFDDKRILCNSDTGPTEMFQLEDVKNDRNSGKK